MPLFDDEPVKPPRPPHLLGEDLASLSIDELGRRVGLLRDEIARLEAEIEAKHRSRTAAAGFFKP